MKVIKAIQGERFDTILAKHYKNISNYQAAFDALKQANINLLDRPVFEGGESINLPELQGLENQIKVIEPWEN